MVGPLRPARATSDSTTDSPQRIVALMATVELTRHLKEIFPPLTAAPFEMDVTSVADVVRRLEELAPGVAFYICDERGRLRKHVNIFIGEEMIRDRGKLTDLLKSDSKVFIAQALSGG